MSKYQKKRENGFFKFLKSIPIKVWLGLAGLVVLWVAVSWAVSLIKAHPVAAPMFFGSLATLIGVAMAYRSDRAAVRQTARSTDRS